MSRSLPDDWPTIYVDLRCETCGEDLASELFRPAVLEKWETLSWFWREVLERHVAKHRASEPSSK